MHRIAAFCLTVILSAAVFSDAVRAQQSDPADSDFDGDGVVGFDDFLAFARGYGKSVDEPGFDQRLDLNGDQTVDFSDFLAFAAAYGRSTAGDQPALLYITDLLAGRLVVINTVTNLTDPTRSVDLSSPRGMAFSPANDRIYVAGTDSFYAFTESSDRVYQVPLQDPPAEPDGLPVARGGFKIALSTDHASAFVTEEFVSRLEVLGLSTGESLASIPVGVDPVGVVASPDGDVVYVAGKGRWIHVIDAGELALRDSTDLEGLGNGRLALSPDGTRIYTARTLVTGSPSVELLDVDILSGEIQQTLEVLDPGDLSAQIIDLALSSDGGTLYVALQRLIPANIAGVSSFALDASLIAVNAQTFVRAAELRLGDQVGNIGLTPDGRTAYVGGISSLLEDPAFKVFIVDLGQMSVVGALSGLDLPAEIRIPAKPAAGGLLSLPELSIQ